MDTSQQAFGSKDVQFFVTPMKSRQVKLLRDGLTTVVEAVDVVMTPGTPETRLGHWKNFPWPWLATAPFEVQPALQKEVPNLGIGSPLLNHEETTGVCELVSSAMFFLVLFPHHLMLNTFGSWLFSKLTGYSDVILIHPKISPRISKTYENKDNVI